MNPQLNIPLPAERTREPADQADRARRAEQDRRGRRFGWGVLAGVMVACVLPAGASAATVEVQGNDVLKYRGGSDRNTLSVQENADSVTVSDTSGVSNIFIPVTDPRPRCAVIDSRTLRCALRFNGRAITRLEAELGDGNDVARNLHTRLPVVVSGGSDNDSYESGNSPFLTRVEFRGGGGFDTVSYAGAGEGPGGVGVRIDNDGVADDGRPGLDGDNIRNDVESLVGSSFADEVTAVAGSEVCCNVTGGLGEDVLRAAAGPRFTSFRMGSVADGADRIIGGSGKSLVDYGERTRPVNVTLDFGGADDGEAGEGDETVAGNEAAVGGSGADTLSAPRFSASSFDLFGGRGDDTIDGADGSDFINGQSGADVIRAFGGDDQVFVNDAGVRDVASCGLGSDSITVDLQDSFEACESRQLVGPVGVLRLTPKTLRARAGESARLKLSWTHPRSWKQLRKVELRIYDGSERVGRVTVRIRGGRMASRGVRLVRPASRITRKGKRVSARLALRLGRSLAGRRLRLEVQAVDRRGVRQLERNAGSIRVTR